MIFIIFCFLRRDCNHFLRSVGCIGIIPDDIPLRVLSMICEGFLKYCLESPIYKTY